MKVVSTKQMKDLDRRAVERFGIPEEILMENAGESTYFAIMRELTDLKGPIVCVCGLGNNGGDGLVVGRKLHSMGKEVFIYLLGEPDKYRGPARLNFEIIKKIGIPFEVLKELKSFEEDLKRAELIVDAIFGTGLTRSVEGLYSEVISKINGSNKKVVSIDIPSGINGDNGKVMGVSIKANFTVTYGLCKYGNLLSPGFSYNGRLYLTHISFPPSMYEGPTFDVEINGAPFLPDRPQYGHKGTFGHVIFVGGAKNYFGAPVFSSLSFLKAGGGYSILAGPKSLIPYLSARANEVVFIPMEETEEGHISSLNLPKILEASEKAKGLVVGPGMGISEEGKRIVSELLMKVQRPILVDGDGLTLLSEEIGVLKDRKAPTILTPHPKEMERLTKMRIQDFEESPVENLKEFSKKWGIYVVYKTARSLIGTPEGKIFINITGNSGMGTAGSGDVLTGSILALYCLTGDVEAATKGGVFLHGMSGDIVAQEKGEDGITANDILDTLPLAMKELRGGLDPKLEERYTIPIIL